MFSFKLVFMRQHHEKIWSKFPLYFSYFLSSSVISCIQLAISCKKKALKVGSKLWVYRQITKKYEFEHPKKACTWKKFRFLPVLYLVIKVFLLRTCTVLSNWKKWWSTSTLYFGTWNENRVEVPPYRMLLKLFSNKLQ